MKRRGAMNKTKPSVNSSSGILDTDTYILNDLAARKRADGEETWSGDAAIPRESDRNESNGVALETTRSSRRGLRSASSGGTPPTAA